MISNCPTNRYFSLVYLPSLQGFIKFAQMKVTTILVGLLKGELWLNQGSVLKAKSHTME